MIMCQKSLSKKSKGEFLEGFNDYLGAKKYALTFICNLSVYIINKASITIVFFLFLPFSFIIKKLQLQF